MEFKSITAKGYELKTFLITILSVFSFFSCKADSTPQKANPILSFFYKKQGMERYGQSFYVKRNQNYAIVILDIHTPFEKSFRTDTCIFSDLQIIIDKYKIYSYKRTYNSNKEIKDGEMWELEIKYLDSKKSIISQGSNAWPPNGREALYTIKKYFTTHFEDKIIN